MSTFAAFLLGIVLALVADTVRRRWRAQRFLREWRLRQDRQPAIEHHGIDVPVRGVDAICTDCGAHHVRHPAMREMRCDPCVAAAFDATMKEDADDQKAWLESKP